MLRLDGGEMSHYSNDAGCTKNKKFWEELIATGRIENVSNNYSIVACVFVTAVTFLPSRCLETIRGFLLNRAVT
jgi:hypothetical protein